VSRFVVKTVFYAFYKLGNAQKSVSAGALPRTPLGKLTALHQTPRGLAASSPRTPPLLGPSGFGHTGYAVSSPTPPKINPSYGLAYNGVFCLVCGPSSAKPPRYLPMPFLGMA